MIRAWNLALLFLLLWSFTAIAQPLRIEYFTVNDGLTAREINDLYIGKDGFLWVSTMDGLNRFDGQSFRQFGGLSGEEASLSRGSIASVTVDNEEKFIVTFRDFFGYFDRFDPRDFSVEQIRLAPSTGVLGHPRSITTDQFGRTFIVTIGTEGTYIYEFTPGKENDRTGFTSIYHEPNDAWTTVAPRVELMVLTNGQFLLYDEEHGFRHLSARGELISRPFAETSGQRRFYTFSEAKDGQVYLSFRDGYPLFRWRPETEPVPVSGLDDGLRYPRIFQDERGQLMLLATEDILGEQLPDEYYLVDSTGRLSLFEEALPTQRAVTAMTAIDFQETVYLGLREGLGVVERYVNPVKTYLEVPAGNDLFRNTMRGMCEDDKGRVYIMEEDGVIYTMDANADQLDTLLLRNAEDTTQLIDFRKGGDLLFDRERNGIWGYALQLGLAKGGLLFFYDTHAQKTYVRKTKYPITAMNFGPDGQLYFGVSDPRRTGLLLKLDEDGRSFTEVMGGEGAPLLGLKINYLLPVKNDKLLIGTQNRGVVAYSPEQDSVYYLDNPTPDGNIREASGMPVYAIHEAADGHYWVGTDGGLVEYDDSGNKLRHFGRQDGLSSNIVYGILPDTSGGFWLSTQNGLVRMPEDPAPGSIRRYYREDGLSNDEFSPTSFLRDASGRYFFGGTNGLTVFREEDLSANAAGADVMLTEVKISGRESERVLSRNLDELRQVTIFPSEKSVAVSFALPAGQRPSSSQFRYRLEGFNDDWVSLTNERTIRFNNLGAGSYKLRVQGAGANGNYGNQELTLSLNVRQYVVEQLWFQVALVATFAFLLLIILQARLREKLRNEQLRTQLSSDIHDEVSGLLAGITLQAELLKNKTDDEKLKSRLHTVGEAGRSAMSKMSDVIWSIDSRRDTIGNLLQRMQEHADEVLLPLDIRYDFRVSGFDEKREIAGTTRQDLYFIYKEAINNIARHSNATKVEIELEQFVQQFELFIRDNGTPAGNEKPGTSTSPGTSVRASKTGQGKDNMHMRAKRMKADLSIDDRAGYTLTLRMRRLG